MNETTGLLDGVTIIRFAHVSGLGGGVETYLHFLDRTLLMRNCMTIIHLFPGKGLNNFNAKTENIGRGELRQIPLPYFGQDAQDKVADFWQWQLLENSGFKQFLRSLIVYNPILYALFFKVYLQKRNKPFMYGEAVDAYNAIKQQIAQHRVDCVILHSATGRDSFDVMHACKEAKIPYILQNHFENSRFRYISMRELSSGAACVAGVSQRGVPSYLKNCYHNLSDGIDTSFFSFEKAKMVSDDPSKEIVLLAARIYPGKGHISLIKAFALIKRQGIKAQCVFAGRCDDAHLKEKLDTMIEQYNLKNDVIFTGNLDQRELRNWYATSAVVVLPSTSEGLGRTLIEAQAMGKPVVAYDSGGIADALVDEKTGFLVPKGDIKNLAARIAVLLRDKRMRLEMGKNGRAFVEQEFSLEALAVRHERCYLAVMKGPGVTEQNSQRNP